MTIRCGRWLLLAALWLGLLPGAAAGLTLADLDGGVGSFASKSGALSFENFDVTVAGALSTDLDDYVVLPLQNGFRLVAPIGVADDFDGDVFLQYDVRAAAGLVITGASLFFNGVAFGAGAVASVAEDLFVMEGQAPPPDAPSLGVAVTGGGFSQKFDSVVFAPATLIRSVLKDIQVISVPGTAAAISVVDQNFTVVPEPGTLALLGLGLTGLAAAGRRRGH